MTERLSLSPLSHICIYMCVWIYITVSSISLLTIDKGLLEGGNHFQEEKGGNGEKSCSLFQ